MPGGFDAAPAAGGSTQRGEVKCWRAFPGVFALKGPPMLEFRISLRMPPTAATPTTAPSNALSPGVSRDW
jgi:hypothetical protein